MINFLLVFYFWALENGTYALISFASASSSISSSSAVSRVDISLRTFCSSAKSRPLTKWVCSMSPPKNLDSCYRKKAYLRNDFVTCVTKKCSTTTKFWSAKYGFDATRVCNGRIYVLTFFWRFRKKVIVIRKSS